MRHILLVEDEAVTAKLETKQLKSYGYDVTHVDTGVAAVNYIHENKGPVDLILMDIDLGDGIDGIEAASQILAQRDIPLVFLSSHTEPEVVEKTEKITSYGYVVKASSITVLDASIKMAFKLHKTKKTAEDRETRYRELFNNIKSGVAIYEVKDNGSDFIFKDFNKAAETMDQQSKEEVIGTSVFDSRPGIAEFGLDKVFLRVWKTGQPEKHPVHFYNDEKRKKYYDNFVYRLPSNELVAVFDDVTEKVEHEQRIIESEKRYRSLFNNNHSAMLIIDPDTGAIVDANPAAVAFYGWDRDTLTAKKIQEINQLSEKEIKAELAKAQSEERKFFLFKHKVASEDIRDVEVYSGPIRVQGKEYLYSIIHDLTKIYRAEMEIREKADYIQRLHNSMADVIFTIKLPERTVEHINASVESVLGYKPDECLGQPTTMFYPDEQEYQAYGRKMRKVIEQNDTMFRTEQRLRRKDGSIITVDINSSCVREHETPVKVISVCRDITQRKKFEKHKAIENAQYRVLAELHNKIGSHREDLFDFMIEASKEITGSEFSFFGVLNEEETEITIHTWSKNAIKSCAVTDQPIHFPISASGIWGDCLRERRIVIYNDYNKEIPSKHGTPEGHVAITRFMGIPIFEGERIVAVSALANKPEPYEEHEGRALRTIYDRMWEMVMRHNAEVSLKEHEKNLEYQAGRLDKVDDAIVASDSHYRLITWNRAAEKMYGWKAAEVIGHNGLDIIKTQFPQADKEKMLDAIAKIGYYRGEASQGRKDGTRFQVEVSSTVLYNDNGEVSGYVSVNRDITGRKQMEELLRESEEKYKRLFYNAPFLSMEVDADTHEIISCNPAMAKAMAMNTEEIEGKKVPDILPLHVMKEREHFGQKALAEKKIQVFEDERNDRYFHNIFIPVITENRRLIQIITTDITDLRQAQKELRENHQLLSTITDNMHDMVSLVNIDGVIIYTSLSHERRLGYTSEFLKGRNIMEFVHPDDLEKTHASLSNLIKTQTALKHEVRYRKSDGGYIWIEAIGNVKKDENGLITGLIISSREITERKKAEEALKNSEARLRHVLETSKDIVVMQDLQGKYLYFNGPEYFNVSLEDILGKTPYDFFEKQTADLMMSQLNDVVKTGTSSITEKEVRWQGKTHWFLDEMHPVIDNQGAVIGITLFKKNITERKKLEMELKKSEERFRTLHNASFGGIAIHDKGAILDCNQGLSDISEYSYDELVSMDGLLLIAPDWRDFVMEKIKSGFDRAYEAKGIRKDGSTYPLRLHAKNIPYRGKEVRVVEFRDISDLKKTQSALEAALHENQMLLAELNHRIKNTFSMIIGLIQLNTDRITDANSLSVMNEISARIQIISELYSLLHQESFSIHVNLCGYFREIITTLQRGYLRDKNTIAISLTCHPVHTNMKIASSLGLLLTEVVTNSLKYAFPKNQKGEIKIDCRVNLGELILDISDNGIGLPEGFDISQSEGLGMLIIQSMANQAGGSLKVESDNGTEFVVSVPYQETR